MPNRSQLHWAASLMVSVILAWMPFRTAGIGIWMAGGLQTDISPPAKDQVEVAAGIGGWIGVGLATIFLVSYACASRRFFATHPITTWALLGVGSLISIAATALIVSIMVSWAIVSAS